MYFNLEKFDPFSRQFAIDNNLNAHFLEISKRQRLSEKHSSDMLNAFSHELVNIKKEFETRLTESIQSISDDFLAGW